MSPQIGDIWEHTSPSFGKTVVLVMETRDKKFYPNDMVCYCLDMIDGVYSDYVFDMLNESGWRKLA